MDPRDNPYAPGAGTPPPELAGRDEVGDISAVTRWSPASAIFYPVERRQFYAGLRARF